MSTQSIQIPKGALLRRKEAAAMLAVSLNTFLAMVDRGELPLVRIGVRSVRIRHSDIEAYIEAHCEVANKADTAAL